MMRYMKLIIMFALFLVAAGAHAQSYPSRPVRVIIPYGPGTGVDVVARMVAEAISKSVGQPFVAEQRVGAAGTIAAGTVANAPADGYTLLVDSSAHTSVPALMQNLPFDTARDFAGVTTLIENPLVLVTAQSRGYKTVADLVAAARMLDAKGVALVSLCLIAYLYFRFVMLNTGSPTVTERSTGFGFDRLDPDEVVARFGMTPYALYAYNVAVSCFSVLLSEPRGGTWELAARLARGQLTPAMMVTVASVVTGTGLLAWVTVTRARLWLARRFERVDQVLLVFLAVLGGNAAICYVYTKDEVMSTAGVFYALAVFAGARELLRRVAPGPRPAWAAMALAAILFAGAGAWAIRSLGLHYHMIQMAFSIRLDWVGVDEWLTDQKVTVETPEQRQLVATLRDQALQMPVENQYFLPRWGQAWFR